MYKMSKQAQDIVDTPKFDRKYTSEETLILLNELISAMNECMLLLDNWEQNLKPL